MLNYTEVKIQVDSAEQKDLLIAALADAGFEGFEEDKDLLFAFIPENKFDRGGLDTIMLQYQSNCTVTSVEQENWNEVWESNFEPVKIADFCYIRADFHKTQPGFQHEIIITPKMSFGTGHHATTCLMIEAMKDIEFKHKTVLDFGTGTGVLAILAEKMGAGSVDALDIDEWSITNAAENITMNHAQKITIHKGDSIDTTVLYDVILANINKNVILDNLVSIKKHLHPGGVAILSGLLTDDRNDVVDAATATGLKFKNMEEQNNWISIKFITAKD